MLHLAVLLFTLSGRVMSWEPSPSMDALDCYLVETTQRGVLIPTWQPSPADVKYYQTYSGRVCAPPYEWDLPPDPEPNFIQYFCVRAVDTSNNYSDCGDITFIK